MKRKQTTSQVAKPILPLNSVSPVSDRRPTNIFAGASACALCFFFPLHPPQTPPPSHPLPRLLSAAPAIDDDVNVVFRGARRRQIKAAMFD